MSQLCFDRSSLIINVVLLCAALEVIVPVSTVPTRAGFDSYTWWEKHSALHAPTLPHLTLLPPVYLSISPLLFLSSSVLWIVSKGSHWCFHTFVLTHIHIHIGLSGVSPEWLGYGGWHVSFIHYWSDPAAVIYRSLRDTPLSLSYTHAVTYTHMQTRFFTLQLIYLHFSSKTNFELHSIFSKRGYLSPLK